MTMQGDNNHPIRIEVVRRMPNGMVLVRTMTTTKTRNMLRLVHKDEIRK